MNQLSLNASSSSKFETALRGAEKESKENSLVSLWKKASLDKLSMDDHHRGHAQLDEKDFSVVEEEAEVNSLGHSSDSDSDMPEIAAKVKFYVQDESAFTLKHTERLCLTDAKINDSTPFFYIEMAIPTNTEKLHFFSDATEYAKCDQIKHIPVELVKKALEKEQKELTIIVDEYEVSIQFTFTPDQGLTENQVLDRIRQIEANQVVVTQRKIKTASVEFFKENTILTLN